MAEMTKKNQLRIAIEARATDDIVRLLGPESYREVLLEPTGRHEQSPLHVACSRNSVRALRLLLDLPHDAGVDVNELDFHRCTPLHVACGQSSLRILRMLSGDPRVDFRKINAAGFGVLWCAMYGRSNSNLPFLLSLGHSSLERQLNNWRIENDMVLNDGDWSSRQHVALVKAFQRDPVGERHRLRIRFHDPMTLALEMYALLVLVSDDFLALKLLRRRVLPLKRDHARRFVTAAARLPQELQALLSYRAFRVGLTCMTGNAAEIAFRSNLSAFR